MAVGVICSATADLMINANGGLQHEGEKYASTGHAEEQDSEEWLQTHNIHHLKLTLKDLVDQGEVGK